MGREGQTDFEHDLSAMASGRGLLDRNWKRQWMAGGEDALGSDGASR